MQYLNRAATGHIKGAGVGEGHPRLNKSHEASSTHRKRTSVHKMAVDVPARILLQSKRAAIGKGAAGLKRRADRLIATVTLQRNGLGIGYRVRDRKAAARHAKSWTAFAT